MLPGDWLAYELSGEAGTTASGLSEAILWDFQQEQLGHSMLAQFGFDPEIIPDLLPSFGPQGAVGACAAVEFGLAAGTPISYRGGDQPNNALSLNVLQPGEVAATAGTSGVVYGVSDRKDCDPRSRFNTFLHVNHSPDAARLGHLLCINGTGIMNSWLRRLLGGAGYDDMNAMAATAEVGARGLSVLPFGNGAERMLGNRSPGAAFAGLDLNRHGRPEICRAVQEGIAFAFKYGMDIMGTAGIELSRIRAGRANMFLSEIFGTTLAGVSGATIELYNTDGAQGAARGAGVGARIYAGLEEAFANLKRLSVIEPAPGEWMQAYSNWKQELENRMKEI
jgi:xylulokinase